MANLAAIRSVGASIAKHFNNAYRDAAFPKGVQKPGCTFTVVTVGGLDEKDVKIETSAQVLIFLHRVAMDPHLRNSGYLSDRDKHPAPVSVELHYLFSFWASSADNEQLVLAWTLRELQATTVLDRSILTSDAGWSEEEIVQLVPEEISTEEMMRIWEAIQPNYRLSLSYVARVVRIDPDQEQLYRHVVASRFQLAAPAAEVQP